MGVQVKERSVEEIRQKLAGMQTLNRITYLESALREVNLTFEIKRFLWGELGKLYGERLMFEKAARAMGNKASMEITIRNKIDGYVTAAEYFAKAGKVDDADEMFIRAQREAMPEDKMKVEMAKQNIYMVCAQQLEKSGKRAGAVKFFEKLIKLNIDPTEKDSIRQKLIVYYKALGHFREARLLEGM